MPVINVARAIRIPRTSEGLKAGLYVFVASEGIRTEEFRCVPIG